MKTFSPYRTIVSSFSTSTSTLTPAPLFNPHSQPTSGFEYDSGVYILSMATPTAPTPNYNGGTSDPSASSALTASFDIGSDNSVIAAALSNRSIIVYDANVGQVTQRIDNSHEGPISEIVFFPEQYPGLVHAPQHLPQNLLISASLDGTIKVFDLRIKNTTNITNNKTSASIQMKLPHAKEEALTISLGYGGTLCAVGTNKSRISFFDLRYTSNSSNPPSGAWMGSYVDAHTEEVTQVRFQTVSPPQSRQKKTVLATASEDGLLAIHDPSQPTEEAALLSVLNVGIPLRNVGFFGPNYEGVWALTGNESMSVWEWDSAQRVSDMGGMNLRQLLSDAVGGAESSDGGGIDTAMSDEGNAVEYLVGCTWAPLPSLSGNDSIPATQALHLLGGNSQGDGYLFRMDADQITPLVHLKGGHKGCIRDFCWVDSCSGTNLVTGGEDARLCEWDLSGNSSRGIAATGGKTGRGKMKGGGGPMSGRSTGITGGGGSKSKKAGNPY